MTDIKNNHTKLNLLLVVILFLSIFFNLNKTLINAVNVDAGGGGATGWKGYAVYRDGVLGTVNDHAAIMTAYDKYVSTPIVHAEGPGSLTRSGSWSDFLDGNKCLGVYKPKTATMTSALQEKFAAKALELRGISYTLIDQIRYSSKNTFVQRSEIGALRCDGVVEYVYEWYGYVVGVPVSSDWDITLNNPDNKELHTGIRITPRRQHNELLSKVANEPVY